MSSFANEYLQQNAQWVAANGHDENGQVIKAAAVAVKCRWDGNQKLVLNSQGEQVLSTGNVMLSGDLVHPTLNRAIQTGDFLNDGTRDWIVLNVAGVPDIEGNTDHYEVSL